MNFDKERELPEIPPEIPKTLTKSRKFQDVQFVAGMGPRPAKIMFLATSVSIEEERDYQPNSYNKNIKEPPNYLKGPTGSILSNLANACGLDMSNCYYTALLKWLSPKTKRLKPTKEMIKVATPLLMWEIKEVDPDIIVCMGKPVFDLISETKFKLTDVAGGWFQREIEGRLRRIYPMECVTRPVMKPEFTERFRVDLREIKRMQERIEGVHVERYEKHYETIRNSTELRDLVERLKDGNYKVLSVDCEWHGQNHVDGLLRSLQICWKPGHAAYIRFRDEQTNYAFDISYKEAGEIIAEYLDRPEVRYVGHHISADLPWMSHVLGLQWYEKTLLDTEFAQQCVDEHSELGLERLCMAYTDLGRWDLELTQWCKANAKLVKDGYGFIPDKIMIPYALADTDGVMRTYPQILRRLLNQHWGEGFRYYNQIFNPFVTDVYTFFGKEGLPIDMERMNDLRDLYHYIRVQLDKEFRSRVITESETLLRTALMRIDLELGIDVYQNLLEMVESGDMEEAHQLLYTAVPAENHLDIKPVWEHFLNAPKFKPGSSKQVRLWLFGAKGMTPVKSTNQRDKGLPSMPWEKVLELPEDRRKEFTPSADGQSLEILGMQYSDPVLGKLLEFKAVDTVCSNFLGEPTRDPDTDEIIEQKGLHKFVASTGNLHNQLSATETGRSRSWKPNILNLPGWVNDKINAGMFEIFMLRLADGTLPEIYFKYVVNPKSIPSVRSIVKAPPGWCIVESDYATAELRGWAYISGDQKMIDLITKPDKHFAKVKSEALPMNKEGEIDKDCVCRLSFPEYIGGDQQQWVMAYGSEGEVHKRFEDSDLLRDEFGNVVHAKQDLHWSLAEMMHHAPREVLDNKGIRGGAKVGNFSCVAEDELVLTRDRSWKPIQHVKKTDQVWDGLEWVDHEGVVMTGVRAVVEYQSFRATLEHQVWISEDVKVSLREAIARGSTLWSSLPKGWSDIREMLIPFRGGEREVKTYDILNAGPRNRFTCQGVIVSNSAYGASGATLERKIEADTGVKPEEGDGQKMLETLEERQPRAFEFMKEMEEKPVDPGYLIAESGRVRHFHLNSRDLVGDWMFRGQAGAQGREARNFYMQESVGATAARAAVWLVKFKFKFQLQERPIAVLYDSVVTLSPNSERDVCKSAHELFMWLANGWQCVDDRILRYPADHDLNQAWSFKATKEELQRIEQDPLSQEPNVVEAREWLKEKIELLKDNEKLSLKGADWMFDE